MKSKKIYINREIMVSDDLISAADAEINAVLKDAVAGTVIYTAGYTKVKQKSLDGAWVEAAAPEGSASGSGSGSTTVSWNNLADRPFYETLSESVIFDEKGVSFATSEDNPSGIVNLFAYNAIDSGESCRIVVDGVTYDMVYESVEIAEGIRTLMMTPTNDVFRIENGNMRFTDKGVHDVKVAVLMLEEIKPLHEKFLSEKITSSAGYTNTTTMGEVFNVSYEQFVEGSSNVATGSSSHAEGMNVHATGDCSHAEGYGAQASGYHAHAEGSFTIAQGYDSHAEGSKTIASGDNQHVQGKYNIEDSDNRYAHIVGNGDTDARSNAHTIDWDGNAWFAGSVEGTFCILRSSESDKRFKLTVDDAGELSVTEIV